MTQPQTKKKTGAMVMNWRCRFGRVQVGLRVYRHVYVRGAHMLSPPPDRWVFQPELIYDRRSR